MLELQKLLRFLYEADQNDFKSFYIFEGAYLLINLLEISENVSRKTKNYAKQIEILKIIHFLLENTEDGYTQFLKIPKYLFN